MCDLTAKTIEIIKKVKKINDINQLSNEIFNDKIMEIHEPNLKYFVLNQFLEKNNQISIEKVWIVFKILIAINPNIIKHKNEENELYALCIKKCISIFLKKITEFSLNINSNFQNKEIQVLFDFLFCLNTVKEYIFSIKNLYQRNEVLNLLANIGEIILNKINKVKNSIIKNMFNNFYPFLEKSENKSGGGINITNNINNISNINNNTNITNNISNNNNLRNRTNEIRLDVNQNYSNRREPILFIRNSKNELKEYNNVFLQKEKSPKKNSKNIYKSYKINEKYKENNNNKEFNCNYCQNKIFNISNHIEINVKQQIKKTNDLVKLLINEINSFINFEEISKVVKENLKKTVIMKIGSFANKIIYPDYSNFSIDLLLMKNKDVPPIKKFFDTFNIFKSLSLIKCSFLCLNNVNEFYECLEKNKASFYIYRTDIETEMSNSTPSIKFNFQKVKVNLYAYNQIYYSTSTLITKIFSLVPKIHKVHLLFQELLLKQYPILNSNFELSILITNFLQFRYKIFIDENINLKQFSFYVYE